jgi:hypothetical protein
MKPGDIIMLSWRILRRRCKIFFGLWRKEEKTALNG